jgi:hypothetical protein
MPAPDSSFDPTHVLVLAADDARSDAEATAAAVDAVLDHADTVELHLDHRALADDHPRVADALASTLEPVDGDDGHRRGRADAARDALGALLAISSFHRFVSLSRVDAFSDDRRVLHYVPDHGRLELDATAAADDTALVNDLDGAVTGHVAGLLPRRTLADWYEDGTRYELEPPSLCVDGDACFDLGALAGVAFDASNREIRLSWYDDTGVVATLLGALGPTRPERFRFDPSNRYEDVAGAFRDVADALDLDVETNVSEDGDDG